MGGRPKTREVYLSHHNILTAMYGDLIFNYIPEGEKEGLSPDFRDHLYFALEQHDIAKYKWDEALLFGHRHPTRDEWRDVITPHPTQSAIILIKSKRSNPTITQIVRCHHVRYDGKQFDYHTENGKVNVVHGGYPRGVVGSDKGLGPAIANISDSICAMTEARPYRKHVHTMETIKKHLPTESGGQFHPMLVEVVLEIPLEELVNIQESRIPVPVIERNIDERNEILRAAGSLQP